MICRPTGNEIAQYTTYTPQYNGALRDGKCQKKGGNMSCLLGIDLGTISVKVVVFTVDNVMNGIGLAEYPIFTPRIGYAEQDPEQ
jgi:hypothetical protein